VSCPEPGRLAAAVTGEDAAVLDHARDCLPCRAALVEQRQVITALRTLARPAMRPERRAELAAEVMAASDAPQPRWRGERVMAIVAGAVAAAAVAMIVLAMQTRHAQAPSAPEITTRDEPAIAFRNAARLPPVRYAAPERARVIASGADYARAHEGEQDVVVLRDGELSVDATDREPVTIIAGDTRVVIAASRAKVVARRGVIVTTRVFAGTAEVTTNGRSQVIDAGAVWTREPENTAEPAASADSIAAFRAGWEHLRAHRHPQAIASFDRATDPVVAEEAAFWGAIASERAGDADGAATRLRAFLERFPSSPRADDARAALVRVAQ
jgi:hypothetical protein